MAQIKFYLKDPKTTTTTSIYLSYFHDNQRMKWGTGISVNPKHWNANTMTVKKSSEDYTNLNKRLEERSKRTLAIVADIERENIKVTPKEIRDRLNESFKEVETISDKSMMRLLDVYIQDITLSKANNTVKKFRTLRNTLIDFSIQHKEYKPLDFEDIDTVFYTKFLTYLLAKDYLNTTVNKYRISLKVFLNWCVQNRYTDNTLYKDFKGLKEMTDIVYLTEAELMHLLALDLSNNQKLNNVRDCFCFASFTGLRYSDLDKVNRKNIKDDFLRITMQKTKGTISVPLNEFAMDILVRNDYSINVISNQKYNKYLKELGEVCGLDETIEQTKMKGNSTVQYSKNKFELISSHTARRTFITLSLEKGMRPETVMEIVGHKDFKTMQNYIKLTEKVTLSEMKAVWTKKPSKVVGMY